MTGKSGLGPDGANPDAGATTRPRRGVVRPISDAIPPPTPPPVPLPPPAPPERSADGTTGPDRPTDATTGLDHPADADWTEATDEPPARERTVAAEARAELERTGVVPTAVPTADRLPTRPRPDDQEVAPPTDGPVALHPAPIRPGGGVNLAGAIQSGGGTNRIPPLRPYVLTRGRTVTGVQLPAESVVQISGRRDTRPTDGPGKVIIDLCRSPRSIVELATRLRLPLQVVKVLVGDLVAAGALVIDRGGIHDDEEPDLLLLQQVLEGLQDL